MRDFFDVSSSQNSNESKVKSTMNNNDEVTITLKRSVDRDGEFKAFTSVNVDILQQSRKVGSIEATIVDRGKIPPNYFMVAMDGHSSELQYVGVALFEPKKGRTKLQSLQQYDQATEFMYIEKLHVDDDCKVNGASDVGASALHQLLNHPRIKGTNPNPKLAAAIYILDSTEPMTTEERERADADNLEHMHASRVSSGEPTAEEIVQEQQRKARSQLNQRADANQFLRNGFFQDPATIGSSDSGKFLVASYVHWQHPIKSHEQATAIQFIEPPTKPPPPSGKDIEIQNLVKTTCSRVYGNDLSADDLAKLTLQVNALVRQGGSVLRSHALHCACANNSLMVVAMILGMEPTAVDAKDIYEATPLMVAANQIAGRRTNAGLPETRVIDTLLQAGARKDLQDSNGLTAYGYFKRSTKEYAIMMQSMTGRSLAGVGHVSDPATRAFEAKLLPPGGPTAADLVGGETVGFVQYSDSDGDSDGDY
jgi:hypothetical protein